MRRLSLLSGALCGVLLATALAAYAPAAAISLGPSGAGVAPSRDDGRSDPATASTDELVLASPDASMSAARSAAASNFADVAISSRADIVVHRVTIALVAPQGTTPSFAAEEARRSLELVDRFYARETGGAIRFELERLIDWQTVDEPIGCSDTGGLHDWISRTTGWQPGPAKHLVAMVPPGAPCPNWANGEQPGDPDDGGRTFQGGPDAILLAHELGHNLSLFHASSAQCASSWDVAPGASCAREEYGNLTDLMGDSWQFTPLSAPTLARLGVLSDTRQPVCGAPRAAVIDTLGAGPGTPRALTWTDPQDTSVRYWAQYNDKADARADGGSYSSPWQTPRTVSGVQILRTTGGGGELLQRPGDGSVGNEFALAGETVTLNSGMSLRVDGIDATTRKATVTVTVPCTEYVGDITRHAAVSASYTSEWSALSRAVDRDPGSNWNTWPRVGQQWLELQWPETVTVDSAAVRFAADAADADQRGLIPPRSWRVEYLDDRTATWTPAPGAAPGTRDRDAMNRIAFTPVGTTALRVLFEAWGGGEYGGSTGVAELTVNGVAPAASLVARGTGTTVPTSTTRDLALGVDVLDSRAGTLVGRSVSFAITGPATFVDGTKDAVVVSGVTGIAALPPIRTGSTRGALFVSAATAGIAPIALAQVAVEMPPSVTATATTRRISGKVTLTVTAKNTGTTRADISIVTAYGSATSIAVAPGGTVSHAFATRATAVPAGSAQVTATANTLRATTSAPYRAF